jgi:ADP-ribose pyrophosphatase
MADINEALFAYNEFRRAHPEFFTDPPNAAFEIVSDPRLQCSVGAGLIYKDSFMVLLRDAVRFRNGSVGPYIRMIPGLGRGGAAVLPVVDGKIVLIYHERHATRKKHWEIPRGFAAQDEPLDETARREILEEIGPHELEIVYLGSIHPDTGVSNVYTPLYLARLAGAVHISAKEGIDELKIVSQFHPGCDGLVTV